MFVINMCAGWGGAFANMLHCSSCVAVQKNDSISRFALSLHVARNLIFSYHDFEPCLCCQIIYLPQRSRSLDTVRLVQIDGFD